MVKKCSKGMERGTPKSAKSVPAALSPGAHSRKGARRGSPGTPVARSRRSAKRQVDKHGQTDERSPSTVTPATPRARRSVKCERSPETGDDDGDDDKSVKKHGGKKGHKSGGPSPAASKRHKSGGPSPAAAKRQRRLTTGTVPVAAAPSCAAAPAPSSASTSASAVGGGPRRSPLDEDHDVLQNVTSPPPVVRLDGDHDPSTSLTTPAPASPSSCGAHHAADSVDDHSLIKLRDDNDDDGAVLREFLEKPQVSGRNAAPALQHLPKTTRPCAPPRAGGHGGGEEDAATRSCSPLHLRDICMRPSRADYEFRCLKYDIWHHPLPRADAFTKPTIPTTPAYCRDMHCTRRRVETEEKGNGRYVYVMSPGRHVPTCR